MSTTTQKQVDVDYGEVKPRRVKNVYKLFNKAYRTEKNIKVTETFDYLQKPIIKDKYLPYNYENMEAKLVAASASLKADPSPENKKEIALELLTYFAGVVEETTVVSAIPDSGGVRYAVWSVYDRLATLLGRNSLEAVKADTRLLIRELDKEKIQPVILNTDTTKVLGFNDPATTIVINKIFEYKGKITYQPKRGAGSRGPTSWLKEHFVDTGIVTEQELKSIPKRVFRHFDKKLGMALDNRDTNRA